MSAVPIPATVNAAPAQMPRDGARDAAASGGTSFLGSLAAVLGPEDGAGGAAPGTVGPVPASMDTPAGLPTPMPPAWPATADGYAPPTGTAPAGKPHAAASTRVGRGAATPNDAQDGRPPAKDGIALAVTPDGPPPVMPLPGTEVQSGIPGAGNAAAMPVTAPRQPPAGAPEADPAAPVSAAARAERSIPERGAAALPSPSAPDPGTIGIAAKATAEVPAGPALEASAFAVPAAGSAPGPAPEPVMGGRAGDIGGAASQTSSSVYPQVAPALISLAGGPPGTQRLTLLLDPAELGQVQIRIERTGDAPPAVSITAERPETLALLQRDQHQLHHALDQAGIPEGRQVSFHGAAPPADGAGQSSPDPSAPNQSPGAGLGGGSGHSQGGQDGARGRPAPAGTTRQAEGNMPNDDRLAPHGWLRAGIDITA